MYRVAQNVLTVFCVDIADGNVSAVHYRNRIIWKCRKCDLRSFAVKTHEDHRLRSHRLVCALIKPAGDHRITVIAVNTVAILGVGIRLKRNMTRSRKVGRERRGLVSRFILFAEYRLKNRGIVRIKRRLIIRQHQKKVE